MILRGQYVTLKLEHSEKMMQFKAFSKVVKDLQRSLDGYGVMEEKTNLTEKMHDAQSAISNLLDLYDVISAKESELKRLKPMTGL